MKPEVGLIGVDYQHLSSSRRQCLGQEGRNGALPSAALPRDDGLHLILLDEDRGVHKVDLLNPGLEGTVLTQEGSQKKGLPL